MPTIRKGTGHRPISEVATVTPLRTRQKPAARPVTTTKVTEEPAKRLRAVRSIDNKMHYRLNKRRALYVRSIAVAKDAKKIKVLQDKIAVLDFALKTLDEVLAEVNKG